MFLPCFRAAWIVEAVPRQCDRRRRVRQAVASLPGMCPRQPALQFAVACERTMLTASCACSGCGRHSFLASRRRSCFEPAMYASRPLHLLPVENRFRHLLHRRKVQKCCRRATCQRDGVQLCALYSRASLPAKNIKCAYAPPPSPPPPPHPHPTPVHAFSGTGALPNFTPDSR